MNLLDVTKEIIENVQSVITPIYFTILVPNSGMKLLGVSIYVFTGVEAIA